MMAIEPTVADDHCGWFADVDEEASLPFVWVPVLQAPGSCFPLPIWHATKENCEAWIKENVLGKGLLD